MNVLPQGKWLYNNNTEKHNDDIKKNTHAGNKQVGSKQYLTHSGATPSPAFL